VPVELPLLQHSESHGFTLLVREEHRLLPARQPHPGEQYRFHFDMTKCIGCKCCVVACNEQNGNPAHLNWRRVGEIEGGVYPVAQRWHMSMGCNHCLEPSCLVGCPVEAYSKDPLTGIVDHNPDTCIGCQYCTWNCSYGVPQFNAERGVVGKCDMCHGRLSQGLSPACVNACPEGAIEIEIVDIAEWRRDFEAGNAPGLPAAADSLSTTRITPPRELPPDLSRVDSGRIQPEHAHASLVLLLVLTQLSIGGFIALWLLELAGATLQPIAAVLPLAIAAIALSAAPLHLGRPVFAYRALKNWKRSWLSREIAALSVFAAAASVYAGTLYFDLPRRELWGAGAIIAGLAGVLCSARIYMVPARPCWNLPHTIIDFYLTCAVLGPRLALASGVTDAGWMIALSVLGSFLQMANSGARYRHLVLSDSPELQASARLLRSELKGVFKLRFLLAVIALVCLPVSQIASFAFALAAELTGRWLFFTSVVPKSMASTFLTPRGAAS
jgi:formate dehydrogenase iron-sulfur subunit